MPYDPYRPIREELAATRGILERGLARSAAGKARGQELGLTHEARMAGLGMQGERLGLQRERAEESKLTGEKQRNLLAEQVSLAKSEREWLDAEFDPDLLSSFVGPEVTSLLLGNLNKGGAMSVNEDGTARAKITNRQFKTLAPLLKSATQGEIQWLRTDKNNRVVGVSKSGEVTEPLFEAKPIKERTELDRLNQTAFKAKLDRLAAIKEQLDYGRSDFAGMMKPITDKTERGKLEKEKENIIGYIKRSGIKWDAEEKKNGLPLSGDSKEELLKSIIEQVNRKEKPETSPFVRKPIE